MYIEQQKITILLKVNQFAYSLLNMYYNSE